MKKKLISLTLVCALVLALGANAVAVNETTGRTNVTFDAAPRYTISIPSGVELNAASQVRYIVATGVVLDDNQKIVVTLSGASNTSSGSSTFHAKKDTSTVTYTVSTASGSVKVGDKVAEFTADGEEALTFSAANDAAVTKAGEHSETLTFDIALVNVPTVPTLADALNLGATVTVGFNYGSEANTNTFLNENGVYTRTGETGTKLGTMEIDGGNLVFEIQGGKDSSGGVTVTFNTSTNSFTKETNADVSDFQVTGITVNGTDITNTVSEMI